MYSIWDSSYVASTALGNLAYETILLSVSKIVAIIIIFRHPYKEEVSTGHRNRFVIIMIRADEVLTILVV